MITRILKLPLTGRILNSESFSGDPDNPVKVVGIVEYIYKMLPPESEFKTLLLEIFPESSEAEVLVEAGEGFWALYDEILANPSPSKILQIVGQPSLDVPKNTAIPLRFNTRLLTGKGLKNYAD